VRFRTEIEYHAIINYIQQWHKENHAGQSFADFLLTQKMAQATRCKHLRQAGTLLRRKILIGDYDLGTLKPAVATPPPIFSDDDFSLLYDAFHNIDFPRFIQPEYQYRYWQCILHFAAITALRREAILGLNIDNIHFKELYVTIPPGIDKKNTERYKPITKELANEIIDLRRFYDNSLMVPAQRKKVFPWIHGTKKWYFCWHAAEAKLGKRFHLHDLKRFAGELALRAGATPMELQQHLDHASLKTTLAHYCRPQTRELVQRIKVPIPKKSLHTRQTPLFTEPELNTIIQQTIESRLKELGIENLPDILLDKFGTPFIEQRTP
jgi:integrase